MPADSKCGACCILKYNQQRWEGGGGLNFSQQKRQTLTARSRSSLKGIDPIFQINIKIGVNYNWSILYNYLKPLSTVQYLDRGLKVKCFCREKPAPSTSCTMYILKNIMPAFYTVSIQNSTKNEVILKFLLNSKRLIIQFVTYIRYKKNIQLKVSWCKIVLNKSWLKIQCRADQG